MSAEADLRFLRQLQRLLEEGLFTATYKFALLQALADLAVERDAGPDGSLAIPLAAIADKFIEYYWRQARPYYGHAAVPADANAGAPPGAIDFGDQHNRSRLAPLLQPLLQNTDRQAAIINLVADAQAAYGGQIAAARAEFANDHIRLLPGVPRALRNFHALITALIRAAWVEQIQRIPANRPLLGEAPNLAEFLFGCDRASLETYRDILQDHQAGQCFYCGRAVRSGGDLDHFIAWSRYPVDLGHNFVFTHATCNRHKRDYLAHPDHLRRWREQNLDSGPGLSTTFAAARLPHDQDRSRQIAWWAYEQGEAGDAHVWREKEHLEPLPRTWREALQASLRVAAEPPGEYRP